MENTWVNTEKYGEVFVTHNNIGWAVRLEGKELVNSKVNVSGIKLIGKSAIQRMSRTRAAKIARQNRSAGTVAPVVTQG